MSLERLDVPRTAPSDSPSPARKTLLDYADEFLEIGEARFLLRYPDPVLVQTEEVDHEVDLGYQTSFMSRAALQASSQARRATEGSGVWVVKKRSGGVFADRIGVGRTRNADVSLPFQRVSKYHAYFSRDEDGTIQLTDAGSKNGTFVGERRLLERQSSVVPFGSVVGFGPCRFVLHSPESFVKRVAAHARQL